jgi:uncharacterized FAD-dependent dehydrogenase
VLKIQGLRLSPGQPESALTKKAQKELGAEIKGFVVLKKSVDARKKDDIAMVYTIGVKVPHETQVLKKCRSKKVSMYQEQTYTFPVQHLRLRKRPVIVGTGPAGLFCGLMLARVGARPILLERGQDVDTRTQDVQGFWTTGKLDPTSNVQFGEGGAGTFSDGKLNTGVNDPRLRFILEQFAAFGAPREILYDAAPHVGTDYLKLVVKNLRQEITGLGGEVRFGHKLIGIQTEEGHVTGAMVEADGEDYVLETDHLVLAIGHSARDTFEMLFESGVPMEQKQFAMGVRIEHLQRDMTMSQYGAEIAGLPVASYKLSCHPDTGHSAFSFCVCPGGQVVAAASEMGRLCTNGMSYHARDKENINGGLLVTVGPEDFGTDHPLGGMYLQRQLEEQAFTLGGGDYRAPCQRVGDFLQGIPSKGPGKIQPSYEPGVTWTDLHRCLPKFMTDTLEAAIPMLGKRLKGYDDPDAVLTAIESRSSSPVRIPRDQTGQSRLLGLYPCGEGAGYAGGIMSAAADGIRTAEAICNTI